VKSLSIHCGHKYLLNFEEIYYLIFFHSFMRSVTCFGQNTTALFRGAGFRAAHVLRQMAPQKHILPYKRVNGAQ